MKIENYIAINELCNHYEIDISFFTNLNEIGLIEITKIESSFWIDREKIHTVEKMIRLHRDLDINLEGIDTIFNLLDKIDQLQTELIETKNRLRLYED
jgi:hypothetical protein